MELFAVCRPILQTMTVMSKRNSGLLIFSDWLNASRTRTIGHCWSPLPCRIENDKSDNARPGRIESKHRRKPFEPRPSPPRNDPTFVGVVFKFKAVIMNDQTHLDVDAQYE